MDTHKKLKVGTRILRSLGINFTPAELLGKKIAFVTKTQRQSYNILVYAMVTGLHFDTGSLCHVEINLSAFDSSSPSRVPMYLIIDKRSTRLFRLDPEGEDIVEGEIVWLD